MDLLSSDYMDQRDIDKENKEIEKLRKIQKGKGENIRKNESEYDKEYFELSKKYDRAFREELEAKDKEAKTIKNKEKNTENITKYQPVKSSDLHKRIDKDINHNHIERYERYLKRLEPEEETENLMLSKNARKKQRKLEEKKTKEVHKENSKSLNQWQSFNTTSINKPVTKSVNNAKYQPNPQKLTDSNYNLSLRLFLK